MGYCRSDHLPDSWQGSKAELQPLPAGKRWPVGLLIFLSACLILSGFRAALQSSSYINQSLQVLEALAQELKSGEGLIPAVSAFCREVLFEGGPC